MFVMKINRVDFLSVVKERSENSSWKKNKYKYNIKKSFLLAVVENRDESVAAKFRTKPPSLLLFSSRDDVC